MLVFLLYLESKSLSKHFFHHAVILLMCHLLVLNEEKHGEYTASQLEGNGALFSVSDALFGLV